MGTSRVKWGIGLLMSLVANVSADGFERHDLGGHPLCEASAAIVVPCAQAGQRCLLVGDNEEGGHLFSFRLSRLGAGKTGVDVASRQMLPFSELPTRGRDDPVEISDIEAMAPRPPQSS